MEKFEQLLADMNKKINLHEDRISIHDDRISSIEDEMEDIKFELLKLGYSMAEVREYELQVKRQNYSYNDDIERNGKIIAMYFMLNMTQNEIADRMGMSQSQVSKIVNSK